MAVLAGSESYDSIKIGFADAIRDINDIIKEGHAEIRPGQKIPVEIFLGGDYKFRIKKSLNVTSFTNVTTIITAKL